MEEQKNLSISEDPIRKLVEGHLEFIKRIERSKFIFNSEANIVEIPGILISKIFEYFARSEGESTLNLSKLIKTNKEGLGSAIEFSIRIFLNRYKEDVKKSPDRQLKIGLAFPVLKKESENKLEALMFWPLSFDINKDEGLILEFGNLKLNRDLAKELNLNGDYILNLKETIINRNVYERRSFFNNLFKDILNLFKESIPITGVVSMVLTFLGHKEYLKYLLCKILNRYIDKQYEKGSSEGCLDTANDDIERKLETESLAILFIYEDENALSQLKSDYNEILKDIKKFAPKIKELFKEYHPVIEKFFDDLDTSLGVHLQRVFDYKIHLVLEKELKDTQIINYLRMNEEKIACIEGPPGTGKTQLIVQFCIDKIFEKLLYSFEEKGDIKPILITSTNNKAVDNVYEKLNEIVKKIFQENESITGKYIEGFLRFGHKNLSDKTKQSIKEKLAGIQESEISVNLEKLKTEIQPLYEFVKNYLNKKEDVYNKIKTLRETKIQLENKMREKNELEAHISELSELLFVNSEKAFSFTRENLKTFQQKLEKLNRASKKFFWRSLNWVMDLFKSSPKWYLYRYCKDRGINLSGLNDIKYLSPEDIINRNSDILNKLEEFVTKNEKVANLEKEISEFFQKQEILIEEINKLSEKLDKEKDKYMKDAKILFARLLEYQFWKAIEEDPKLKNFKPEENSWGYVKSFSIMAPVMLTTALSIRNDFPLNKDLFDTVIIDEGSQMLLTYALPIYLRGERLIVVGDTHQLGPVTQLPSNGAHRDELENYFKELPDHLIYKNSVMEALEKIDKTDPSKRRLKEHFRCNKDIIGFCNELIGYGLEVYIKEKSVPNLDKLPEELRKIFEKPMAFINVKGQSEKTASGSKLNEKEANFIKGLIEALTRYLEPTDIAIITPYRAQSDRIFNVLKKNNKISSEIDKLVIGTVHRLQGDERKIVLISAVDIDPKEIIHSPLWSSKNLVNVAVSRAENHLILIGCENAIESVNEKENPLHKLYIYIKEKGCTFNEEDFQFLVK